MDDDRILLIFPIGWVPTYPYLALPLLKGYLNTKNVKVEIFDDNLNFYQTILSKSFFEFVKRRRTEWNITEKYFFHLYKNIDTYKEILQGKVEVNSYKGYQVAVNVINNMLEMYGRIFNLKISLHNIDCNDYALGLDLILEQMMHEDSLLINYLEINNSVFEKMENARKIGFSITSKFQLISALCYSKLLRKKGYEGMIFLGGNYISRIALHKEKILNQVLNEVNCIILYEGESIIEKIARDRPLQHIPNIIYKKGETIVRTSYDNIKIEETVCPDFDGFILSEYMLPELILPIYSSINCYNNCYFCNISGFQDKKYKQFNLRHIVDHMERLKQKYNANIFYFVDQTFSISRMIEFANILIERSIGITWLCDTRIDRILNKDEIIFLKESGCIKLQIGLESYNQRVLNLMNKNVQLENITESVQNLVECGLAFHLFCMYGYPGETKNEIKNTLSYIRLIEKQCTAHGSQYFSYGLSKFQLEKGSYISFHPEKFGLNLLEENKNDASLILHYENEEDALNFNHAYDKTFELAEAIGIDELDLVCIRRGIGKEGDEVKDYEIKLLTKDHTGFEVVWKQVENVFIWRQTNWMYTFHDLWISYHLEAYCIDKKQIEENNYKIYTNKRFSYICQKDRTIIFYDLFSNGFIRGNIYSVLIW